MPQIRIPDIDYVSFLLYRKYPQLRPSLTPIAKKYALGDIDDDEQNDPVSVDMIKEGEKYKSQLSSLSKSELKSLYSDEQKKINQERDQKLFFDNSQAVADFDYWSKMAHWKLDEALALRL